MNKLRVFNAQHKFDSRRLHQPSPSSRGLRLGVPVGEGCRAGALAKADIACQLELLERLKHPEVGEGCGAGALAEGDSS